METKLLQVRTNNKVYHVLATRMVPTAFDEKALLYNMGYNGSAVGGERPVLLYVNEFNKVPIPEANKFWKYITDFVSRNWFMILTGEVVDYDWINGKIHYCRPQYVQNQIPYCPKCGSNDYTEQHEKDVRCTRCQIDFSHTDATEE